MTDHRARMNDIADRVVNLGINLANELPGMVKDIARAVLDVRLEIADARDRHDVLAKRIDALEAEATAPPKRKG